MSRVHCRLVDGKCVCRDGSDRCGSVFGDADDVMLKLMLMLWSVVPVQQK
jgi:hypothetical protein